MVFREVYDVDSEERQSYLGSRKNEQVEDVEALSGEGDRPSEPYLVGPVGPASVGEGGAGTELADSLSVRRRDVDEAERLD